MTLISTGSTLMPWDSSHLMASLIWERLASSSRQTMPISSVTLTWRMLKTTGNFWPSSQMMGRGMSLAGYISQRRLVSWASGEVLESLAAGFLSRVSAFEFGSVFLAAMVWFPASGIYCLRISFGSAVPSGLGIHFRLVPALKRRVIFVTSLRVWSKDDGIVLKAGFSLSSLERFNKSLTQG